MGGAGHCTSQISAHLTPSTTLRGRYCDLTDEETEVLRELGQGLAARDSDQAVGFRNPALGWDPHSSDSWSRDWWPNDPQNAFPASPPYIRVPQVLALTLVHLFFGCSVGDWGTDMNTGRAGMCGVVNAAHYSPELCSSAKPPRPSSLMWILL